MLSAVWILLGLGLLLGGGEAVVRGASRLALALGVRPLVVGLTVVAMATSAPELAASTMAALRDNPALALGNVIGSNIANIGLILGLAGLVRDIPVKSAFLSREVPVLVASSALLLFLLRDGVVSRPEAGLMLALLVVYLALMVRMELRAATADPLDAETREAFPPTHGRAFHLAQVLGGVALLVVGADRLVLGATDLARAAGLSDQVVGLTVVAVGTSLPELASSLAAARKGEGDLVLGNVVGSNIFNILGILGLTGLVRPLDGGGGAFTRDLWVMVGFTLVLVPLLRRGQTLFRAEAAVLLVAYGYYTLVLLGV